MSHRMRELRDELFEHLPFTVFSVAAGMAFLGFMTYGATATNREIVERGTRALFHVFHPLHLLFSATATTAMFYRHESRWVKAVVVGAVGAVGICGLSDVFLPHVAGLLLGVEMHFHWCILEHPLMILPYVVVGLVLGLTLSPSTRKGTILSHSAHVLVSGMASLLYLVSFGLRDWVSVGGMVLIYMVAAVMLPCCTSDIVFPILVTARPADRADAAETAGQGI